LRWVSQEGIDRKRGDQRDARNDFGTIVPFEVALNVFRVDVDEVETGPAFICCLGYYDAELSGCFTAHS
jgi:hypothetical protein